MPGAVRQGDSCEGEYTFTRTCIDDDSHQVYTETVTINCNNTYKQCCTTVFINGRSAIHLGCSGCVLDECRPAAGSPNVFVRGQPKHRRLDAAQTKIMIDTDCDGTDDTEVCCTGKAITASTNVFVNG